MGLTAKGLDIQGPVALVALGPTVIMVLAEDSVSNYLQSILKGGAVL